MQRSKHWAPEASFQRNVQPRAAISGNHRELPPSVGASFDCHRLHWKKLQKKPCHVICPQVLCKRATDKHFVHPPLGPQKDWVSNVPRLFCCSWDWLGFGEERSMLQFDPTFSLKMFIFPSPRILQNEMVKKCKKMKGELKIRVPIRGARKPYFPNSESVVFSSCDPPVFPRFLKPQIFHLF